MQLIGWSFYRTDNYKGVKIYFIIFSQNFTYLQQSEYIYTTIYSVLYIKIYVQCMLYLLWGIRRKIKLKYLRFTYYSNITNNQYKCDFYAYIFSVGACYGRWGSFSRSSEGSCGILGPTPDVYPWNAVLEHDSR